MKIIVTGSAGFMGSHLVDYLIADGHIVYGIDDLSGGYKRNISKAAETTFMELDLKDAEATARFVEKVSPDIVYHLASWAHEGLSQFMPILITENNYNAYLNILIPAIRSGVKRVVCTSSMSVYGDQEPPFNEDMLRKPEDIYAVAKTAMEEATEILADVHGFEYVIVRPHNVYGPRQRLADPYRNVVAIFMNRVMKNQPPIIYGDGKQTRAFTYIEDVTPYLAQTGFQDNCVGQIINLGSPKPNTVEKLSKAVLRAFSREDDLQPLYMAERPREVKHAYCSHDKAIELLGVREHTSLEEGIQKMAKWAKEMGPQEFKYLGKLELEGDKIPETWKKQLM